ncbi:hypothetical protein [Streptomyces sp. NPDC048560]|uniref:hypothetical protein n=1 Tax=Streptomyces sp. NPDC048560 TaxID=3155488 RepID=UPI003426D08B
MADLEQREDRAREWGATGFVPWLMTLMILTPLALAAVWLGGSLGVALVGDGWNPPPFTLESLYALVDGGTAALWPGAPAGAVVAGVATLAGALFGVAALGFFAADPVLASVSARGASRARVSGEEGAGAAPLPVPVRRAEDAGTASPAGQAAHVPSPDRSPGARVPAPYAS